MSTEQLLRQAAQDGTFTSDSWPTILEDICKRIDTIVNDVFPRIPLSAWQRPRTPSLNPSQLPSQQSLKRGDPSSQDSQATDKENEPPPSRLTPERPPVPPFTTSSLSTAQASSTDYILPPDLAQLHQSIKDTLRKTFPAHPPFTIQRLAELILHPNSQYRVVAPYLRALDRVVNVSSNVNQYPLTSSPSPYLLNGGSTSPPSERTADELGSDESLGGALLTPIPWLNKSGSSTPTTPGRSRANTTGSLPDGFRMQNESSDMVTGPDGKQVKVETVSVVNGSLASSSSLTPGQNNTDEIGQALTTDGDSAVAANQQLKDEAAASKDDVTENKPTEETPHARGPDAITAEDTGKVDTGAGPDFVKAAGKAQDDGGTGNVTGSGTTPGRKNTKEVKFLLSEMEDEVKEPTNRMQTRSQSSQKSGNDGGSSQGNPDEMDETEGTRPRNGGNVNELDMQEAEEATTEQQRPDDIEMAD